LPRPSSEAEEAIARARSALDAAFHSPAWALLEQTAAPDSEELHQLLAYVEDDRTSLLAQVAKIARSAQPSAKA